ncbi:Hypothetical predicted protein, partial [Olea europaea subsp. europaea]
DCPEDWEPLPVDLPEHIQVNLVPTLGLDPHCELHALTFTGLRPEMALPSSRVKVANPTRSFAPARCPLRSLTRTRAICSGWGGPTTCVVWACDPD